MRIADLYQTLQKSYDSADVGETHALMGQLVEACITCQEDAAIKARLLSNMLDGQEWATQIAVQLHEWLTTQP